MRLIKITADTALADPIKDLIFQVGIKSFTLHSGTVENDGGESRVVSMLDLVASTPQAKKFEELLISADFFDLSRISLEIRQGRSALRPGDIGTLTRPLAEPFTDLRFELWQFSHLTPGLAGRVLIASCILGYGMIEANLILMVGGLLFLPLLPLLLGIASGFLSKEWTLVIKALLSFLALIGILLIGGICVALLSDPPMRYDGSMSAVMSLLISGIVGLAAGLATIDDTGRRELIGLAAAGQISVFPVWFGIHLVFGSVGTGTTTAFGRGALFLGNVVLIVVGAAVVFGWIGYAKNLQAKIVE